jgi:hypothetical protein
MTRGIQLSICFFCLAIGTAFPQAQSRSRACQQNQVTVSDRAGVALGSLYINLNLKNISHKSCILAGAPRVTAPTAPSM